MYSRRLKVEEEDNKRKAIGFTLLTIAFLAFMLYFGLPLLAQVSNFGYDLKKSSEPVESSDKTPPPPPHFNDLPSFTKDERLDVNGTTEAGVKVFLFINSQKQEVIADNDGRFSASLNLIEGENELYSFAEDQSGNKSHETETLSITLDKKNPDLEVSKPKDGDQFIGSKQKQITIQGQTEKDVEVQINGRHAVIDSTGAFTYIYGLNDGENILGIKAQDQAGNITEKSLTVTFTP